jgi:lysophospholipase L1-like esterase
MPSNDTSVPTRSGTGRRLLGLGLAGVAAGAVVGVTAGGVRRLRESARQHAHDLDHRATVGEGPGEPLRLLVVGDSAARGFGLQDPVDALPQQLARRLAAATGRRVEAMTTATDGHRTREVVAEQLPLVRAARPDAVVVLVGVNDAVAGTRRADLAACTAQMLSGLATASQGAVTVLLTCPDLSRAPGAPPPLRRVLGWRCRRVAAIQQDVASNLGVTTVSLPDVARHHYGLDGFHPGVSAHAVMAERAADALLEAARDVLVGT